MSQIVGEIFQSNFSNGSLGHVESNFVNTTEKNLSKSPKLSGSIFELESNSCFFNGKEFA